MLGKEACNRKRWRDLRQFLHRFCPDLDKTRQKFFRQSLIGIMQSGSLTVSRWLPWIEDGCGERFYRHKRLLNQFKSRSWDHATVLESYQRQWAKHIQIDTPIIIDLTDLPRPRARKLPYLALVRDGSEDKLHYGYWCVEVYAYFGRGLIVPLLLDPYSIEHPETESENARILQAVSQVMSATEGRGVLVMDIGADRNSLLVPWLDDARRFVIRLRGDRHLLLDNGVALPAVELAEKLLHHSADHRHGFCRVYLPERPSHPLYLVCKTLPGQDKPLMLLTTFTVEDLTSAKIPLTFYRWRWKCEEGARFLKSDLGIEQFALRIYESFPRLFLLAALAMSFLTWLALRYPRLHAALCAKRPGYHKIKFAYYRLRAWLQSRFQPTYAGPSPP